MKKMVMSLVLAGTLFGAPTLADAALGDQTLRQGMSHNDVVELQDALKDTGHFRTSVNSTGFFGTITVQAVRDFQRANGLTVDGIVGPQTFRALGVNGGSSSSSSSSSSASSSSSSSSVSINFSRTLRQGVRGNDVVALQDALKQTGHFRSSVNSTGFYGTITVQAVRDFQRANGLTVDGIAGPQTFGALNGSSSSSATQTSTRTTQTASSSTSSSTSGQVSNILSTARSLIGTPYTWGGSTPRAFDCSGFVQYSFAQHGVSLPRTSSQMWSATTRVSNPRAGDLVFFNTSGSGVSHVGIYLGNNQFIHSGASTGVTIASMSNSYWAPRYLGAGRVN
nr:peptidoglycan-binding protein [Evansella clarkii]